MPIDGIVLKNLKEDIKNKILLGRVDKIYQPSKDEIIISFRTNETTNIIFSVNSMFPKVHITNLKYENPQTPPAFCMLLRKYLVGARVTDVIQKDLDRIIIFIFESKNEMGDKINLSLRLEIMGKHSNLMLINENNVVIDALKRIPSHISSRQVLPGKELKELDDTYKSSVFNLSFENLYTKLFENADFSIYEALYKNFIGVSPFASKQFFNSINFDYNKKFKDINSNEKNFITESTLNLFKDIENNNFSPNIILTNNNDYLDFHSISFNNTKHESFNTISEAIEKYFINKELSTTLKQKSSDIYQLVNNLISKSENKIKIYKKELEATKKMDEYKLKGELISAYVYNIEKGSSEYEAFNYYDDSFIKISLDSKLSPSQNSVKYFDKYNKLKRTKEQVEKLLTQTKDELSYFESLQTSLESALDILDIKDIKDELIAEQYIKKKKTKEKNAVSKSKPIHYISSDGVDIYVGKNNKQNDELTMKFADSNDLWLHTKDIAGSHVIIKGNAISDKTLFEAANLAAYHSKAKLSSNIPIDYTERKNVKKPNGSKPGMVIYTTNKTIYITPDLELIRNLKQIK